MRIVRFVVLLFVPSFVICLAAHAQAAAATAAGPAPAWADPANWKSVKPAVVQTNIVYATVPHVKNPSAEASPNPGTPNGVQAPVPNTGPAGTLDMHLDVYQIASTKPSPVVIQLHGGGWIRGDRPSGSGSFGAFFAAGMSVVAVQYRNAIDAPAPAAIEDVRCAMSWIKKNAAKYNFDPNRVITWGGSAGGHLALMAAYAPASFNPAGCTDQPKVVAVRARRCGRRRLGRACQSRRDAAPPRTGPALVRAHRGYARPCPRGVAAYLHSSRPAADLYHQRRPGPYLQSHAVLQAKGRA